MPDLDSNRTWLPLCQIGFKFHYKLPYSYVLNYYYYVFYCFTSFPFVVYICEYCWFPRTLNIDIMPTCISVHLFLRS